MQKTRTHTYRDTIRAAWIGLGAVFYALPASGAPIPPQLSGANYVFAFPDGGPRFEVEPAAGGRIISLKLGTAEYLFVNRTGLLWGSVFWPAPQSVWGWPPPQALNLGAYTGGVKGDTLKLASAVDNGTKYSQSRSFSTESADTTIRLTYTLKNNATAAKQAAPWAITRVLSGGLTFWAKGPGPMRGHLTALVKEQGGWVWFDHGAAPSVTGDIPKVFADGTGWLAHVDPNGRLLLQVYPDITQAQAAPEEAEISVYTDPARQPIELEHQGAYAQIKAGDSVTYASRWYLRQLPVGAQRKAGDPILVAYVKSLLERAPTGITADRGNRKATSRAPIAPGVFRSERPGSRPVDAGGRVLEMEGEPAPFSGF